MQHINNRCSNKSGDPGAPQGYVSGSNMHGPHRGSWSMRTFTVEQRRSGRYDRTVPRREICSAYDGSDLAKITTKSFLVMLCIIEEGPRGPNSKSSVSKVAKENAICTCFSDNAKHYKITLCYVAWSLALFNSTYAKSTHHFLLLSNELQKTQWYIQNFPDAELPLFTERGKKCSHFSRYQSSHVCILMLKHPTMPWAIHIQNDPSSLPMPEQP